MNKQNRTIHTVAISTPAHGPAEYPLFAGKNSTAAAALIYGPNGSGKSSMARAIKRAADQQNSNAFIDQDRTRIYDQWTEENKLEVHVFNEDYVDENLRIQAGQLRSFAMLGQQVEADDRRTEINQTIAKCSEELEKARERRDKNAAPHGEEYKRRLDTLRKSLKGSGSWAGRNSKLTQKQSQVRQTLIEELVGEYETFAWADYGPDNELDIDAALATFERGCDALERARGGDTITPIEDFPALPIDVVNLAEILTTGPTAVAETALGTLIETKLKLTSTGEVTLLSKEHFEDGRSHNNESCPFCFQEITANHAQNIIDAFKEVYDDSRVRFQNRLKSLKIDHPDSIVDIASRACSESTTQAVQKSFNDLTQCIDEVNRIIDYKIRHLDSSVDANKALDDLQKVWKEYHRAYTRVQNGVLQHNENVERVNDDEKFLRALNSFIAMIQHKTQIEDLADVISTYKKAASEVEQISNEFSKLRTELRRIHDSISNFEVPLEVVNGYIDLVFAEHRRLELVSRGDIFEVLRYGSTLPPSMLSTGERNILALCYFFGSLQEGKSTELGFRSDLPTLLVLDDPVSSFDTDNRYGVYSLLRKVVNEWLECDLNQVAILTHDQSFAYRFFSLLRDIRGVSKCYWSLNDGQLIPTDFDTANGYQDRLQRLYQAVLIGDQPDNDDQGVSSRPITSSQLEVTGNDVRIVLEAFATFEYGLKVTDLTSDATIKDLLGVSNKFEFLDDGNHIKALDYFSNRLLRIMYHGESHADADIRAMDYDFDAGLRGSDRRSALKDALCLLYWLNPTHVLKQLSSGPNRVASIDDAKTNIEVWLEELLG